MTCESIEKRMKRKEEREDKAAKLLKDKSISRADKAFIETFAKKEKKD